MTGTAAELPAAPPPLPAWHMYRALCAVGLVSGVLIATVYELTRPIIRQNLIEARQRAILHVLPGAIASAAFRLTPDGRFERAAADSEGDRLVFAGYGRDGSLRGLAIEARGMGYQDVIRLLYGYAFDEQAIIGIRVLESRETPGLGDRIETDPEFLRNFERLDVALDAGGRSLRHPIEPVKHGDKHAPWQVDCITGATISSKAVAAMLRESSGFWLPQVSGHRPVFEQKEHEEGHGDEPR